MKKMEYKTRKWHDKCFQCVVCKTQVGSKPFIIPNETDVYCVGCFEEKFATKCTKCKKIMTTGGVTFKNEVWSVLDDFFDNERTVWTVNGVLGGLEILLVLVRIMIPWGTILIGSPQPRCNWAVFKECAKLSLTHNSPLIKP